MEKSFPLDELIDIDELQSIQDSFARAAGISSVIFSPEGEPLTRLTNPTGFCSLIQSTEKGKERCFRSFMEMGKNALLSKEPEICYCFAHGGHFVAPIIVDGEHKGTMFAGQFIPEKFSSEQLHDLETIAPEIDLAPGLLVKEAEKMRVVGEDVIRNYSTLLFKIVETIARRGVQAAELIRAKDALEKAHEALELRFRDIAGAMSDWVWEVDAGARYTYCSEKVKDVLGYTAEEMIGKTPFDLVIPDETESVGAEFTELVRERRTFRNMENWIRTKDGRSVCMLTSGGPILDDAGELLGYRGVDSDITERKRAEQKIENLQRYNRELIEVNLDPLVTFDHKGIIMDVNGATIQATGRTREELIGTRFADYFTDPERAYKSAMLTFETGGVRDYELVMKASDGTETIVSYNTSIYRDQTGDVVGAFAAARDITEQKAAEEEVKKKTEELEGVNKLAVGRELKMIELKKEINALLEKSGREPGYKIVGEPQGEVF